MKLLATISSRGRAVRVMALAAVAALAALSPASAQEVKLNSEGEEAAYVETIIGRSQKIVDQLNIADAEKALNVRNIICNRYFLLNRIHSEYDKTIRFAKDSVQGGRRQHIMQSAENKRDAELFKHHFELETALSLYLDEAAVETVKDGLTYGVVNVTYKAYCDMIPSLSSAEKKQILAWLKEAREYSMDQGDSKGKHGMFTKYKGRINNYLSARGYNINEERKAWEERRKK